VSPDFAFVPVETPGSTSPLWAPSAECIKSTRLAEYVSWLNKGFVDYHDLWAWSVSDVDGFWASLWEFFAIRASHPYERVRDGAHVAGVRWFPGAQLSYAEHVFRGRDDDTVAIVHASELRPQAEMTWRELREATAAIRAGLVTHGVRRGDRVAAYMPNIPETTAAFLACASLGAIWSSAAPEFGVRGVIERFAQIEPKVLLAVDGYRYGGRDFDRRETFRELIQEIPSLQASFVLPYLGDEGNWDDLLGDGELEFEQLPFDHPLWILYSSGTTGPPKAIVHGQGGILIEHLKKLHLHTDLRAGDRFFWFTTTGWMMWNFLMGGLLTDAAIVLFDGSPATPDLGRLWDLAQSAQVTTFGTSAAFINSCLKAKVEPANDRDLKRLRAIGSTGSPLSAEAARWLYTQLGGDMWLFSTSGGTDVCTAFVGGVPTLPVYAGELQARSLGAKVEAYNEQGQPVVDEVGELVLTEPMPSMPIYFWNDGDGERYHDSYFTMFPGVWRHGDWIEITSRGTAIIYGRSDSTINRGGVRMGTAEIYRVVLASEEVVDALVVDVPRDGTDGWIVLFLVLREGTVLDPSLEAKLRRRVREDCSPRHVPDEIRQVPDVPRTLSGKILEVPVKRILMGHSPETAVSRDALANPHALDIFVELATSGESDEVRSSVSRARPS
jgi:acetoacetyl-CoA synthetase